MTIWNIKRMNMYRCKKSNLRTVMLMTMMLMLMTIQLGQSRKRVVILRILIFSYMKESSAKEKNWVKKWMETSAMRGGEAPKGYCHEKLWILELGGDFLFI